VNWETLLCIGDSITYGARSYAGYPEYAGRELEKRLSKQWNVINESVSGFTTIDLCRQLSGNYSNLKGQAPSIITIMTGTNDVKLGIDVDKYAMAYSQLITKAKIITKNVILLKLPHFSKGVMYPYTFEMNSNIDAYNIEVEQLAKKHSVRCHEFDFKDSFFFDGVHLNEEGSESIALQLANLILSDKGVFCD